MELSWFFFLVQNRTSLLSFSSYWCACLSVIICMIAALMNPVKCLVTRTPLLCQVSHTVEWLCHRQLVEGARTAPRTGLPFFISNLHSVLISHFTSVIDPPTPLAPLPLYSTILSTFSFLDLSLFFSITLSISLLWYRIYLSAKRCCQWFPLLWVIFQLSSQSNLDLSFGNSEGLCWLAVLLDKSYFSKNYKFNIVNLYGNCTV